MLTGMLESIRRKTPRVHCIANTVTVNDCANLLLAVGASPIMADDPEESAQITAACSALTLSLGTPSKRRLQAMRLSAEMAKHLDIPVILDPVGVTVSDMRRAAVEKLMESGAISVIRGNASEIRALAGEAHAGCVLESEDGTAAACAVAEMLARTTGTVVAMTGDTDIVTDGLRVCRIDNGHSILRSITGAGCQLTALLGAFAAVQRERYFEATVAGVCMMGLCGEIAHERMSGMDGNAACRGYIIDAAYHMTDKMLREGAKYAL